jgi:hypothetical protein
MNVCDSQLSTHQSIYWSGEQTAEALSAPGPAGHYRQLGCQLWHSWQPSCRLCIADDSIVGYGGDFTKYTWLLYVSVNTLAYVVYFEKVFLWKLVMYLQIKCRVIWLMYLQTCMNYIYWTQKMVKPCLENINLQQAVLRSCNDLLIINGMVPRSLGPHGHIIARERYRTG